MRARIRVARWRQAAVVALALALSELVGCSDGSVGAALYGPARGAKAGGSSGPGSGSSGASGGGNGSSPGSSGGTGTENADGGVVAAGDGGAGSVQGRALFEALYPSLDMTCGGACHAKGAGGAPLWLGPPDPYHSAVTYKGIVVANAGASILLTKGRHEGPALVDPLQTQVTQWLQAEAAALTPTSLAATDPFTPTAGHNDVDASKAGVAGVHITFDAAISASDVTLTNLDVVAPAASGVHVVYPIFATVPSSGGEIDDSSFSNLDQTIAAGQTTALGPGELILTQWSTGAQMKIEFTKIAAATVADGGGLTGGCKAVASFTANAVPAIQNNTCLNCHNTGGSGNAALDLSGLASNPPDDTAACAQALTRANPQNPAQSDIVLAPTGQVANHPFKNASQSFVQMMETWIAAEK